MRVFTRPGVVKIHVKMRKRTPPLLPDSLARARVTKSKGKSKQKIEAGQFYANYGGRKKFLMANIGKTLVPKGPRVLCQKNFSKKYFFKKFFLEAR